MKNSMKASQNGLKIYSEPFVELFGIPLMYNHSITDPDLVRSFFNSDQVQELNAPRKTVLVKNSLN